MLTQLARFTLRLHIVKKASSLWIPERLHYLALARRVHGIMFPFSVIAALSSAFVAAISLFPELEVSMQLAARVYPEDRTISLCIGGVFLVFTGLLVLMTCVILRTREMLAGIFVETLVTYVSWCSKTTKQIT
jgi:hypothetical protein